MNRSIFAAAAVAALAVPAVASADILTDSRVPLHTLEPKTSNVGHSAVGDLFGAEVTGFTSTGGAYLADDADPDNPELAVFGSSTSIGEHFAGSQVLVSSTQTMISPTEYEYTINWAKADGTSLLPPGANIGGSPVIQIGFELGENNAVPDPIQGVGGDITGILDAFDPVEGVYLSAFSLLDSNGDSLYDGNFFTTFTGDGVTGVSFIGAGGADLSTLDIGGATATIRVSFAPIPEPASAGLLAAGSLMLLRRRRA